MHSKRTSIAALVLFFGCAHQAVAGSNDVAEIYGKFLDAWTGNEKASINVSVSAKAPSAEELKDIADCAPKGKSVHWMQSEPISDLTGSIGNLSYVHLVDPDKWSPRDPSDLMAQGQSVDSAVKSGFEGGLFTFSAIVFDEAHGTAAFAYSFSCGALCGNGGTVIFHKGPRGWVRSSKPCGNWMSYLLEGRSNNSFKPNLLRYIKRAA